MRTKNAIEKKRMRPHEENLPRRPAPSLRSTAQPHAASVGSGGNSPKRIPTQAANQNLPPEQNLRSAAPLVTPRGDGTFIVAPGRPRADVFEVGSHQASEMLGISISALRAARESKLGQHYLRWRFTSENQRVIAWELPALMAYKEATRSIGK